MWKHVRYPVLSFLRQQPRAQIRMAADEKIEERMRMGIGAQYLSNKPERIQNIAKLRVVDRSSSLIHATARLKEFTRTRQFESGWEFFESTKGADIALCNAALHLCAKAAWFDRAQRVWEQMDEDLRDVVSFGTMINVCAKCKQPEYAEAIFVELCNSGLELDIISYNSMISVFGTLGQSARAVEYFNLIPTDVLNGASVANKQVAYQSVMSALARDGDYARTRSFFVRMTSEGIPPNHTHFNALMTSCAQDNLADTAQAVFEMMPHYSLIPNVVNWTILLNCNRYNLPRCRQIMQEMERACVEPSSLTYLELAQAHVLAKDGPGARALIGDIEAKGHYVDSRRFQRLTRQLQALPP